MIPCVWWEPDGWNFSVAKAQSFKVYLDLILLRLCVFARPFFPSGSCYHRPEERLFQFPVVGSPTIGEVFFSRKDAKTQSLTIV